MTSVRPTSLIGLTLSTHGSASPFLLTMHFLIQDGEPLSATNSHTVDFTSIWQPQLQRLARSSASITPPCSRLPVSHRPPPLGWHAHPLAVPGGTARVLTLHLPLDSTISQVTMDGKALRYALKLPSQRYALWRGAGPLTGPFASTRLNVTSTRIGKVVCRNFATSSEATG